MPLASRPTIIALVGIDGSGKTTQARGLADWLTATGVPARYWQNAGGRRWFGRLARRLGQPPDGQLLLGRAGMLLVEAVLRWLAIGRAVVRSRCGGEVAVMDRYAVCQYASIRAHTRRDEAGPGFGERVTLGERVARVCYRLFPTPDVTFLLAAPAVEAHRRIEQRGTDHERLEFLAVAAAAYDELPEASTFIRVDASGASGEVARAIRAHLLAAHR